MQNESSFQTVSTALILPSLIVVIRCSAKSLVSLLYLKFKPRLMEIPQALESVSHWAVVPFAK